MTNTPAHHHGRGDVVSVRDTWRPIDKPLHGIKVEASVTADLAWLANNLSPEQLDAFMRGVGELAAAAGRKLAHD